MRQYIFAFLLSLLLSCSSENRSDCSANFHSGTFGMKVSLVSGQTYRFELCNDARTSYPAFTIYGGLSESGLASSEIIERYRLSHVRANRSGDSFEVTFPTDLYFVIYADTESSGVPQYAIDLELLRGSLALVSTSALQTPVQ